MQIEVFRPHGFVRLVDWHGDEMAIINAARVSFANESEYDDDCINKLSLAVCDRGLVGCDGDHARRLKPADRGLLRFLLSNRHGSPFEHGFQASFHIRLPIFVMREWVRHRIGHSVNEESGRYTELRPDFYYPQRARTQVGKPGAYKFEDGGDAMTNLVYEMLEANSRDAFATYKYLLAGGVAKEMARLALPLNLYTEIRWTCNARSLMHFLGLRNMPDAQFEIRQYASALEQIFAQHMPTVHADFVANERKAP